MWRHVKNDKCVNVKINNRRRKQGRNNKLKPDIKILFFFQNFVTKSFPLQRHQRDHKQRSNKSSIIRYQ